MAIEVPNLRDPLLCLYNVPLYQKFYYHKSHLWYFTSNSLNKVMSKNSFKGKVLPLQEYNILNHMNWIYANTPQSTGTPGRSKPVLPLRSSVDPKTGKVLNDFIQEIDVAYRQKLGELDATACLFYVGKLAKQKPARLNLAGNTIRK